MNPDEMKFLQGLRFVILKYNEDLHAKCYLNDDKMVITSLNLYEFSMANNKEMGVLIDKNDPSDAQLFDEAYKEVDYINQTSQRFDLNVPKTGLNNRSDNNKTKERKTSDSSSKHIGYCIRTGVEIPFNIEKPMCKEAFKSWNKYGDLNYPEKFCHFSGDPSNGETSMSKPILKKYWQKAQELLGDDLPF